MPNQLRSMRGPGVTPPDHPNWRGREADDGEAALPAKPFLKVSRIRPSGEQQKKGMLLQDIMANLELESGAVPTES